MESEFSPIASWIKRERISSVFHINIYSSSDFSISSLFKDSSPLAIVPRPRKIFAPIPLRRTLPVVKSICHEGRTPTFNLGVGFFLDDSIHDSFSEEREDMAGRKLEIPSSRNLLIRL